MVQQINQNVDLSSTVPNGGLDFSEGTNKEGANVDMYIQRPRPSISATSSLLMPPPTPSELVFLKKRRVIQKLEQCIDEQKQRKSDICFDAEKALDAGNIEAFELYNDNIEQINKFMANIGQTIRKIRAEPDHP